MFKLETLIEMLNLTYIWSVLLEIAAFVRFRLRDPDVSPHNYADHPPKRGVIRLT